MTPDELRELWELVCKGDDEQSVLTRKLWIDHVGTLVGGDLNEVLLYGVRIVAFKTVPEDLLEVLEEQRALPQLTLVER